MGLEMMVKPRMVGVAKVMIMMQAAIIFVALVDVVSDGVDCGCSYGCWC